MRNKDCELGIPKKMKNINLKVHKINKRNTVTILRVMFIRLTALMK